MIKFDTEPLYERRYTPIKTSVSLEELTDAPKKICEDSIQNRYRLRFEVNVDFWSTGAQLRIKEKQAKKTANSYIFKDMLPLVEEILLESTSEEITMLAIRLKKAMIGE